MHRVVITTAHPGLIPWLGPDVVLFMPSGTVCFNPVAVTPLNPKARRPVISLRYDDTRFDSGRLPPAVEHAVLAAQRGVVRETLTSRVQQDAATAYAARVFELPFDGLCTVHLSPSPDVPPASSWRIGALLGPSGCGKSTHLAAIAASWEPAAMPGEVRVESFTPEPSSWPADLCVLSHLCLALGPLPDGTTTAATRFARQTAAAARLPRVTSALAAAGLRKEAWQLPFSSLSSGEQELAALAYALITPDETALTLIVADEFTSALDDSTAYATAVRLAAYVRTQPHLRLLVAGVRDVRDWLRPDWAYDVPAGRLDLFAAGAPAAPAPPAAQPPPGDGDVAAVAALFKPPTVSIVVRSLPSGIAVKNRHLLSNGSGALWEHVFKNQHYLVGASQARRASGSWEAASASHCLRALISLHPQAMFPTPAPSSSAAWTRAAAWMASPSALWLWRHRPASCPTTTTGRVSARAALSSSRPCRGWASGRSCRCWLPTRCACTARTARLEAMVRPQAAPAASPAPALRLARRPTATWRSQRWSRWLERAIATTRTGSGRRRTAARKAERYAPVADAMRCLPARRAPHLTAPVARSKPTLASTRMTKRRLGGSRSAPLTTMNTSALIALP
jgi:ABC-type transport system involved in cytochrome c biogenesis ATPase subunit